jgi:predicted transcriptional regulator
MNITSGFKIVMERYGVNVLEIAKLRGTSCRAVSKAIGTGHVKKVDTIASYCETIGCSVAELMREAQTASEKQSTK